MGGAGTTLGQGRPPHVRLAARDRLLLWWVGAYWLIGFASNAVRAGAVPDRAAPVVRLLSLVVVAGLVTLLATHVRSRSLALRDLGFTLGNAREAVMVGLAVAIAVVAWVRLPPAHDGRPVLVGVAVVAVVVEETVFRPILIDALRRAFARTRRPAAWAVGVAAACWAAAHLPSYPVSQVLGGHFAGGVVLGALYVFSGSNAVGVAIHTAANAGGAATLIVVGLYILLALLPAVPRRASVDP